MVLSQPRRRYMQLGTGIGEFGAVVDMPSASTKNLWASSTVGYLPVPQLG